MAATCLSKLVGITESTTIPYYSSLSEQLQTSIAESSSGLFLDTMTGGIDLYGIDDEEYMKAVLEMGLRAARQAEKILSDELLIAINNRFHPTKTRFSGFIGRRSYSQTLQSTLNLQGQRLRMIEPIAGIISIKSIGVCVNGVGTFNVYVARCNHREHAIEEILYTFPVTTAINIFTNVDMSSHPNGIDLPMQIEGIPQDYFIYWSREDSGGLLPKNNDLKCNTCNNQASMALSHYMEYNGIAFTDTSKVQNVNTDRLGHGLSISANVGCDHSTVICREYEKKDTVKLIMNVATQYKAGELWIEYLQKSGWVNRDNMQNREYLWGKRNHFKAEFDKRITTIANIMELGETNCYSCKESTMFKGTIFS